VKRGYEVLYNVGGEGSVACVLRLNGKSAERVFRDVIEALAKHGATVPTRISNNEQVYTIREDLGPVIGAYLVLVRRARNIEKWSSFLQELLEGRYAGVARALSSFLEIALELSKSIHGKRRGYTISPIVADALSSALKRFVDKIIKARKADIFVAICIVVNKV
jgi:hypothetical protein